MLTFPRLSASGSGVFDFPISATDRRRVGTLRGLLIRPGARPVSRPSSRLAGVATLRVVRAEIDAEADRHRGYGTAAYRALFRAAGRRKLALMSAGLVAPETAAIYRRLGAEGVAVVLANPGATTSPEGVMLAPRDEPVFEVWPPGLKRAGLKVARGSDPAPAPS